MFIHMERRHRGRENRFQSSMFIQESTLRQQLGLVVYENIITTSITLLEAFTPMRNTIHSRVIDHNRLYQQLQLQEVADQISDLGP